MKRIFVLLLALALLLLLAGCAEENISGCWDSYTDFQEFYLTSLMEELELPMEVMDYVNREEVTPRFSFIFRDDGTYEIKADAHLISAGGNFSPEALLDAMMLFYKEEERSVSFEEFCAKYGVETDTSALFQRMGKLFWRDYTMMEGCYIAKGGKLYLSASVDTEPDKVSHIRYKRKDKTLILTGFAEEDHIMFSGVGKLELALFGV